MPLNQITPFVPCTSLAKQIDFYRDVLGFSVGARLDNYAYLSRDTVSVRLVKGDADVDLTHPERQVSFYIDVTDLDKVYETMQPELANLPEGRVRAPFDQAYGHREFHVADEDCTFILFGEAIH